MRPICLVAGDAFVLCSDGFWAYFDDAELGRRWSPRIRLARLASS
jgi:hypothetical protein